MIGSKNLSGQILLFLTGTSSLAGSSSIRGVPELSKTICLRPNNDKGKDKAVKENMFKTE